MRSVNTVVIPELSYDAVLRSVRAAEEQALSQENTQRQTTLDFYYNDTIEKYIEKFFSKSTLKQVPAFPQKIVPRFAKARCLIYKQPPERLLNDQPNEIYNDLTPTLDPKMKEFNELVWLLGESGLLVKWDERKNRFGYQ